MPNRVFFIPLWQSLTIMSEIIARRKEQDDLKRLYEDKHPEFTVVYGRRRVGKTFLIRQFFRDNFAFFHTALSPYEDISPEQLNKQQLINFQVSLVKYGDDNTLPPTNWIEAFSRLEAQEWLYFWTSYRGLMCKNPVSSPPSNIFGTAGGRPETILCLLYAARRHRG